MKLSDFKLERYFARHEFKAPYLLCCSDCESLSVKDLLALEPGAADALQNLWLGYTESSGHPDLREAISTLYRCISPDQVLVHTGAEEAIFNFMNVALEPDDHIIVHEPAYQSLAEVARSIGCRITPWTTDPAQNWRLDLNFLKDHLQPNTRVVVINCPHNPTGYLMSRNEFEDLIDLSREHGFIIFSDEVYRHLEYDPETRLPALCDRDDRGVSLGVMSKSFGLAGLRIGWIASRNRDLVNRMAAFKDYTTICNSAPSEYLATVALRHKDPIIERNLTLIKENLSRLRTFFNRHQDRLRWLPPPAGPIAFPEWLGANTVEDFCRDLLEKTGVLLLPGTLYRGNFQNFRIGFGRKNLPECIERFETYLDRL
jgi:aspartate/methionine/tyrosine aminotransferase